MKFNSLTAYPMRLQYIPHAGTESKSDGISFSIVTVHITGRPEVAGSVAAPAAGSCGHRTVRVQHVHDP